MESQKIELKKKNLKELKNFKHVKMRREKGGEIS